MTITGSQVVQEVHGVGDLSTTSNSWQIIWNLRKFKIAQECIPVGCVPPTAVAVCLGGVGVSASVHAGIHPPRPGPGPLNLPPGCGPGDPPPPEQND